jgi:hypothetical protein
LCNGITESEKKEKGAETIFGAKMTYKQTKTFS